MRGGERVRGHSWSGRLRMTVYMALGRVHGSETQGPPFYSEDYMRLH